MIGIIGAMEEEVAELKKDMQIDETIEQAGMVFCKGSLGGKDVVIVRSGIGKVNAGICAQILVDRFGVDTLINTGIAGSLDAQLDRCTASRYGCDDIRRSGRTDPKNGHTVIPGR